MAKILLADVDEGRENLARIVHGKHELVQVKTIHDLKCSLEERPYDLIIVGVHFDDSRAFDALRLVKAHRSWKRIPVIVFRQLRTAMSDLIAESLTISVRALGAEVYLDMHEYIDTADPDFEILCEIERHLPKELHQETACEERNDQLYDQCDLHPDHVNQPNIRKR